MSEGRTVSWISITVCFAFGFAMVLGHGACSLGASDGIGFGFGSLIAGAVCLLSALKYSAYDRE